MLNALFSVGYNQQNNFVHRTTIVHVDTINSAAPTDTARCCNDLNKTDVEGLNDGLFI